jgi:PAS domain S-box-containing protein
MTTIDTAAYDLIPLQVWTAREDGGLDYVNTAVTNYFCVSAYRLLEDGWRDLCHPLDARESAARWAQSLLSGEAYETLFRLLRGSDRQYRWHYARAVPIRGADGRIVRWIGTNIDIDQIKRGEEMGQASAARAQAARERVGALLAQAPVAITVTRGPEHQVELSNRLARRAINGRNIEGQALARALPELVGQGVMTTLDEAYRIGMPVQVHEFPVQLDRNGDGELVQGWFDISYEPLRDARGEVDGVMVVSVDVTSNVEARREVERLHGERAAVLEQLVEGVIITDREGRITFVNEAAEALHGCALLDVPPERYAEAYQLFTEEGAPYPANELPLARAILHDETVRDGRWRIHRADGTVVRAIGSARPVRDRDGTKIGAVLTLRQAGPRD